MIFLTTGPFSNSNANQQQPAWAAWAAEKARERESDGKHAIRFSPSSRAPDPRDELKETQRPAAALLLLLFPLSPNLSAPATLPPPPGAHMQTAMPTHTPTRTGTPGSHGAGTAREENAVGRPLPPRVPLKNTGDRETGLRAAHHQATRPNQTVRLLSIGEPFRIAQKDLPEAPVSSPASRLPLSQVAHTAHTLSTSTTHPLLRLSPSDTRAPHR